MKKNKMMIMFLIPVVAFFLFTGCAGKAKQIARLELTAGEAPPWVNKGSGAFDGEIGQAFYGVASSSGIRNPALLRTTADNRARAEIARIFKTYTAALMKDYAASTMAGNPEETSEEQHVEQAIKTFTKAELAGVEIVDHWQDPASNEYFSLARLDLSTFENHLEKARELSDLVRERVVRHAEKAFEELSAEEARHE